MRINRLNYEEFLIDYLDGNLDPVLTAELMVFISENPGLEKQLLDLEKSNCKTFADTLCCPDKNLLKKNFTDIEVINEDNFNEFCIAELEGLLKDKSPKKFSTYMRLHPGKEKDYILFKRTILIPDKSIHYQEKDRLKKERHVVANPVYLFFTIFAAAAVIAFIILFTIGFQKKSEPMHNSITSLIVEKDNSEVIPASEKIQLPIPNKARAVKTAFVHLTEENQPYTAPPSDPTKMPTCLESIPVSLLKNPYPIPSLLSLSNNSQTPDVLMNNLSTPPLNNNNLSFTGFINKVNVWKAAENAVKGFNYLTESEVEFNTTLDEKGNLTNFIFRSETFSITATRKN
jgi:hypothetical protein